MEMKFDHIGIVVEDIKSSIENYSNNYNFKPLQFNASVYTIFLVIPSLFPVYINKFFAGEVYKRFKNLLERFMKKIVILTRKRKN